MPDKDGQPQQPYPLPWPAEMLNICYDAAASVATGQVTFKWPYPGKDWSDNLWPWRAMNLVQKAMTLFSVPESQWQDDHNKFFMWMFDATTTKT